MIRGWSNQIVFWSLLSCFIACEESNIGEKFISPDSRDLFYWSQQQSLSKADMVKDDGLSALAGSLLSLGDYQSQTLGAIKSSAALVFRLRYKPRSFRPKAKVLRAELVLPYSRIAGDTFSYITYTVKRINQAIPKTKQSSFKTTNDPDDLTSSTVLGKTVADLGKKWDTLYYLDSQGKTIKTKADSFNGKTIRIPLAGELLSDIVSHDEESYLNNETFTQQVFYGLYIGATMHFGSVGGNLLYSPAINCYLKLVVSYPSGQNSTRTDSLNLYTTTGKSPNLQFIDNKLDGSSLYDLQQGGKYIALRSMGGGKAHFSLKSDILDTLTRIKKKLSEKERLYIHYAHLVWGVDTAKVTELDHKSKAIASTLHLVELKNGKELALQDDSLLNYSENGSYLRGIRASEDTYFFNLRQQLQAVLDEGDKVPFPKQFAVRISDQFASLSIAPLWKDSVSLRVSYSIVVTDR